MEKIYLQRGKFALIDSRVVEEIIKMQTASEQVAEGLFEYEGRKHFIAVVSILGKRTWFIDGRPLLTFLKYEPFHITAQIKLARGSESGERQTDYEVFVAVVIRTLGCAFGVVFPEDTCDYFNEISCIDNGFHPFSIIH